MYVPSCFQVTDASMLHAFMERHSFAVIVTAAGDGLPFASHVPVLLDRQRGPRGTMIGHFARANPHADMDHAALTSLAIFHGPHGYISPGWYRSDHPHVPTWNYTAVHACGRLQLITDAAWLEQMLQRLVATHESSLPRPWSYDPSDPLRQKLLSAIIGFEMPIEKLEGKFKLSQNRDLADRTGAVAALESTGDARSQELARAMRAHLQNIGM
jgi:transcriptional regulator